MNQHLLAALSLFSCAAWCGAAEFEPPVRPKAPAQAVDLSKIDRTIRKEPAYKTKSPKYCLLVFGPEAKTRVWLVLDGDVLYVDRNGSSDLTEKGKRVDMLKNLHVQKGGKDEAEWFIYRLAAGQVREPGRDVSHGLTVGWGQNGKGGSVPKPPDKFFFFEVAVRGKLQQYHSTARFADRPHDAPVIPFAGRLTPLFLEYQLPSKLVVSIGTKGWGESGGTNLPIDVVPKDIHPVADLEFPNKVPGGKPIRRRIVLDQRC